MVAYSSTGCRWAGFAAGILTLLALGPAGCAGKGAAAVERPAEQVWVVDFLAAPVDADHSGPLGALPTPPPPPPPLPVPGDPLGLNKPADPEQRAQIYVDRMAETLVAELNKAGFAAHRIGAGQAVGTGGWVVRGAFTHLEEGREVERAMVGFGAGAADIRVAATLTEATTAGAAAQGLDIAAISSGGAAPGAVVVMNPYVAAAKLAISHGAPEREISRIGREIAGRVVERVREAEKSEASRAK